MELRRWAAAAALGLAAPAVLGARFPVDEEIFYPEPLSTPSAILVGEDRPALGELLPGLGNSPRPGSGSLWAPQEVGQAGGRSEVMAAISQVVMSSDRYCATRAAFETAVCRIARQESLDREGRALLRAADGRFSFNLRELDRVKLIFKRVKRALFEVIEGDSRLSKPEKERIVSKIAGVELSEYSFITDLKLIKDEKERALLQARCVDGEGRFLVDNSFFRGGRIYLCPFHLAKAFAAPDEGRPEEIMVFNLAHLLAHAMDPGSLGELPHAYEKAQSCYAQAFAGVDDPYGLGLPGTFGPGRERLCCCQAPVAPAPGAPAAADPGLRACLETRGCGAGGCDLGPYLPELLADQWAFSALGRYIKREQDYAVGGAGKLPTFITRQNREMFSKNMYPYCGAESERPEDRDELDPGWQFTRPRPGFRLAEARKNRVLAKAIFCPSDPGSLREEFGESCWGAKPAADPGEAPEAQGAPAGEGAAAPKAGKRGKHKHHRKKAAVSG